MQERCKKSVSDLAILKLPEKEVINNYSIAKYIGMKEGGYSGNPLSRP